MNEQDVEHVCRPVMFFGLFGLSGLFGYMRLAR